MERRRKRSSQSTARLNWIFHATAHRRREPVIIKKHQRRLDGFDYAILSLYSRGLSTRDIKAHLEEIYGVEVSPDLISSVTEAVIEEVREWQSRPLEAVYPIVYLDALRVKIRYDGTVQNRCVYLAIGVKTDGKKEPLGLWTAENEGSKFRLSVLTELNNRGVKDIFIACIDGLRGFTEAIESVFPQTITQLCFVHQIRNSLTYISYEDRKAVVSGLKPIYTAVSEDEPLFALELFGEKWNAQLAAYQSDVRSVQRNPPRRLYDQRD